MIINEKNFTVDCKDPLIGKLSGTLRLPSPTAYHEPFEYIKRGINESNESYTINSTNLDFLNSSGLTAIARLLMHARKVGTPIKIIGNANIPWQTKSFPSLKKLWDQIDVELI